MNPYVAITLTMCLISAVALVATGYLAASFNRRAKTDLAAALSPLAEAVGGEADLEAASVAGRYAGHLVEGRMANAEDGPGRVFRTDLIDPAGGAAWRLTSDPARGGAAPPRRRFESADLALESRLCQSWDAMIAPVADPTRDRFRLEYDPGSGRLRFSKPMRSRRDIPDAAAFRRQLDLLVGLGPANRRAQGAPDADWAGGRAPEPERAERRRG